MHPTPIANPYAAKLLHRASRRRRAAAGAAPQRHPWPWDYTLKVEGAGGLFRDHDLLVRSQDPRRIDLRMSLRDRDGGLCVL